MRRLKFILTFILFLSKGYAFSGGDTLTVRLKITDVNKVLTFNQGFVPGNNLEYLWEVMIDTDNNISTGNANGFDVGLVIKNIKLPGSISYTGTIISGSDLHTVIYNGNSSVYGNELTVFFGENDSTLYIKALPDFPEVAAIQTGNRIKAKTLYYSGYGIEEDETNEAVIPGIICDAPGDVSNPFIDILQAAVENPVTGIAEGSKEKNKNIFYPNPTTGKLKASFYGKYIIKNSTGTIVLENETNELDLSGFPEGIYFIVNQHSGEAKKIVLRN